LTTRIAHNSVRIQMDSAGAKVSAATPARKGPFEVAAPPPLSLPKSGGALRGLGEKFQAGGPTGTGSFRVPLPVSPCRGAEPALALSYDTGHGAGPFGIGWTASVPSITRRTDRGIPRYQDATASDVFILSSQEDLVPELTASSPGGWTHQATYDGDHRVDAFRPRVEGSFARVERRTHKVTGDTHWRSITADNVTHVFGLSPGARIANPKNPLQVFRWLLEATYDALGHVTFYEYKGEDLTGVSRADRAEASRFASPPANAYLKRVHYGNRAPLTNRNPSYADIAALSWLFEVVFDYGEHATDLPEEVGPWTVRPDPFSSFRAGFEIRTYRLCRRVLSFHEIPEELGAPERLVRATELTYDASPTVTYLTSIREVGYAWGPNDQVTTAAMPTLRLDYTRVGALSTTVSRVDPSSLAHAPSGIDGQSYSFVDLDGEGIAGILSAATGPSPALHYKRNLGGGAFAAAERLSMQPARRSIAGGVQLLSLNADGRLDVAMMEGPTPGFYERTRDFAWSRFSAFSSVPRIDWQARGVHLLDVDGDGLTDVLVAQDNVFVWYPSLARNGFGPAQRVTQAHDEDRGTVVLTTDDYETIFLADMTGDGLHDLVRIRNGEVCYWPNLGYGRFGARIAMKNAPRFDRPDLFDPRRIRLGDVDGTGVTDIVYLSRHGADVYLNQAGNGWDGGTTLPLPLADTMASVRLADFLGTGTACLVWSSSNPADAGTALRYVDLLRSTKPHLLCSVVNGLGAQTTITYAPSTKFYLEDRRAGRLWATRLPFVVQTVAQVETTDAVAGTRVVLRHRYAHGFYDGVEREFRGFARVDSWDAESMSAAHGAGSPPGGLVAQNGEYDLPPVHTVSWFHTGAWNGEADDLRAALSVEFYGGDPAAPRLAPDTVPATLLPPALREAYRALKGRPLREEVYAEDGTSAASAPYVVKEYRYEVREVQPTATQRHGVYHPFEREHRAFNYERNPADPRIAHRLALEVDLLGHVVREAQVAYARRTPAEPEQGQVLATCRSTTFADPIATAYEFRHGVATETAQYELFLPPTAFPLPLGIVDAAMTGATALPFDAALAPGTMRTIEHVRHQFWADDLSAPLPQGQVQARALTYDHFALAFPATLLASVFGSDVTSAELLAAGYVSPDGDYWAHAGTTAYDAASFYQPTTYTDPFGNVASVVYDPLRLAIVEEHTSADPAFDNVTTATIDYRVLAPSMVTDPNGNRSAAAFDELGRVAATAVMGKPGAGEGDTLTDPTTRIQVDLLAWQNGQGPASVHTFAREKHGAANPRWQESYSYSDGSGREVMRKIQAAPDAGNPRWVGTGRTVFDNKGNAVKKYEPYFSPTPAYEDEPSIAMKGVTPILRYDPLGRLTRTDFPNGTFETVVFDAWSETHADRNDNVLESAWYAAREALSTSDPERRAADAAAKHAHTPTVREVDPLGRTFLVIEDNGLSGTYATRTALDIQGNARSVTDARGNVALAQTFDLQAHVLRTISVDAGEKRALRDVAGNPIRSWDERGFATRTEYDRLRRPLRVYVTPPESGEILAERLVYGEAVVGGGTADNVRGRKVLHYDGAGELSLPTYDFKGNLTTSVRRLAVVYQQTPDWKPLATLIGATVIQATATALLELESFTTTTAYDALNRPIGTTTPDVSTIVPTYNEANLLEQVHVHVRGASAATAFVDGIAYDAKGQRESIAYGDDGSGHATTTTVYTYDPLTFELTQLKTTRTSDRAPLQNLAYTHDPVGNLTEVTDGAQQRVFFANDVVLPTMAYVYDALYRLIQATGREQAGRNADVQRGRHDVPLMNLPHQNDAQAVRNYQENYDYDEVGNILQMIHATSLAATGWTRRYKVDTSSNRLLGTSLPGDGPGQYSATYGHDACGNMASMPHLSTIGWDFKDQMVSADKGGGGLAYFAYDAAGERVRKVWEHSGLVEERIYLGGYEVYRKRPASAANPTLERQTLHVMDGKRRIALVETTTADASAGGAFQPSTVIRYQLGNHLDSAVLEVDQDGMVISYEEYHPYGTTAYHSGTSAAEVSRKRYRYTGKERDEETGLYYHGARYYAPWLGRWTGADPLGIQDHIVAFSYCRCAPTVSYDLDGKQVTRVQIRPWQPPPFVVPPPPDRPKGPPPQGRWMPMAPPPPEKPRAAAPGSQNFRVVPGPPGTPAQILPGQLTPRGVLIRGPNEPTGGYFVGPHGEQVKPRSSPPYGTLPGGRAAVESHHGLPSTIAKIFIYNYKHGDAPSILMRTLNHDNTRAFWNDFVNNPALPRTPDGKPNWKAFTWEQVKEIADSMLQSAKVPDDVRQEYFRQLDSYRAHQENVKRWDEYNLKYNTWKIETGPKIELPPPRTGD
jgi:RHS repeat-associated protein